MALPRNLARAVFHRAGGLAWARYRRRSGLRILMYHRFTDALALERQCKHLRRRYHLLSLNDAAKALRSGGALPPYSLAVTVDDGYRDFLLSAHPVFSRYQVPVTVFLATDFIDRKEWLWVDRAGEHLVESLKRLPNDERLAALKNLPATPSGPPENYAPLSWDDVRSLAAQGVDFGAHTRSHPILSRVADQRQLSEEIDGSRKRIEQELQKRVAHFCYPNGKPEDIGEAAVEVARQCGFDTAVTTIPGLNYPGADLFLLKRIGVTPEYPEAYFRQCAAGFRV